jgi:hypothetical protein
VTTGRPWWRSAAIYQIYVRSFADGNGDGIGDLEGVRARLPYVRDLGIDAIWFTPWYPSPMADGGYDVADYRDIDPQFGTLAEAEQLIEEATALGLRVIVDVVPNHCSYRHRWFEEALAAGPGSPERRRFWFQPGRGAHGELPPNNWLSIFGGSAWTRTRTPTALRASGTCTSSLRSSLISTGTTRTCAASTRTCCGSGSTAASQASASTQRALLFKDPALPGFDSARRPESAPVHRPGRVARRLPLVARTRERIRRRANPDRRALAAGHGAFRPLPAPRRDAHGVQLRVPRLPVAAGPVAGLHRFDARSALLRSARRQPGCSRTTT